MRHPISHALYELCDEGVLVTSGEKQGVYDSDGRWLSGHHILVCPNMCGWIGRGSRTPSDIRENRRFRSVAAEAKGASK